MKNFYFIIFIFLLNLVYTQCDNYNQLQCNNNNVCEWIEDITYGSCSEFDQNSSACESMSGCYGAYQYPGWYSGWYCAGGSYQIDNSYCQDIPSPPTCDEMTEFQCISDQDCNWIEDVEAENCYDILDCTGGCTWQDCEALEGCNWYFGTAYYDPSYCYGEHEVDNSYCEEIEMPECSEYLTESNCNHDEECDWIENIELESCNDINSQQECNAVGCSWYSGNYYACSICCWGEYEVDNSYCEEMEFQLGDINFDGIINIQDIIQIIDMILTNQYNDSADINDDGNVNILDVLQIVDYIINS